MKEILKEWEKFIKAQEEARQKVSNRMFLWLKENPPQFGGLYDYGMSYKLWEMRQNSEEYELKKKFGVVDVTLENMLTSLISNQKD